MTSLWTTRVEKPQKSQSSPYELPKTVDFLRIPAAIETSAAVEAGRYEKFNPQGSLFLAEVAAQYAGDGESTQAVVYLFPVKGRSSRRIAELLGRSPYDDPRTSNKRPGG